jgi:hypothetical protein
MDTLLSQNYYEIELDDGTKERICTSDKVMEIYFKDVKYVKLSNIYEDIGNFTMTSIKKMFGDKN